MKHQVLFLVISCMAFSLVLGGCEVEESFLVVRELFKCNSREYFHL